MPKVFFENKATGKRFEVLSQNTDGTITLKGEFGTFTEPYDKEKFKALGYKLVKEEVTEGEDA